MAADVRVECAATFDAHSKFAGSNEYDRAKFDQPIYLQACHIIMT